MQLLNRPHRLRLIGLMLLAGTTVFAAGNPHQLADAAQARDTAAVRRLLTQHASVNEPQGGGATALHWASQWNDLETAEALLHAGADVNVTTDQHVSPLLIAALNASAPMVTLLLNAGANANAASIAGESPLMTAAQTGSIDVVQALLDHGADVRAKEASGGQTALMRAVAENHLDIARVLLARGAEVSARSTSRFTPLLFAAQQGNLDMVRLLIAAGANPDESAPDGIGGDTNARLPFKPNTLAGALLVAIDSAPEKEATFLLRRGDDGPIDKSAEEIRGGYVAVATFLLDRGADPNQNGAGRTPLHAAVQRGMPDLVELLLEYGADPDARLTKPLPAVSRLGVTVQIGATPFWMAASYADLELMHILVDGGANPRLTSKDNTTPLMVAAGLNFVDGMDKYGRRWFRDTTMPLQIAARDAVSLCLALGNDVNAVNNEGNSAMVGAVYFGGTLMAQFLADNGGHVNVKNKRGQTPWSLAQGRYNGSFVVQQETSDLLEQLGADTQLGVVDPEVLRMRADAGKSGGSQPH